MVVPVSVVPVRMVIRSDEMITVSPVAGEVWPVGRANVINYSGVRVDVRPSAGAMAVRDGEKFVCEPLNEAV